MRSGNSTDNIYKEVVVVGNGPSGIALSYMLSGNLPYVVSDSHPDEMFSMRLHTALNKCLVHQDFEFLSSGLEGRSTNPVSLLLDSLLHPCADIGLEMDSLIEWRKNGVEIDHVVLGKGPPGGSWHTMDPHILTLSLGSWMGLPGLPFQSRDSGEKRAFACNVAQYYEQYVNTMNLSKYFHNGVIVMNVKQLNTELTEQRNNEQKRLENFHPWVSKIDLPDRIQFCSEPEIDENCETENITTKPKHCALSNAFNFMMLRSNKKIKTNRCCKRPRETILNHDLSPNRKIREVTEIHNSTHSDKMCEDSTNLDNRSLNKSNFDFTNLKSDNEKSISFSCDSNNFKISCDNIYSKSFNDQGSSNYSLRNSYSLDFSTQVPCDFKIPDKKPNQSVHNLTINCDHSSNSSQTEQNKDKCCNWLVEAFDTKMGKYITYTCKYLVLANGASDVPNRLTASNKKKDPSWLLYDSRSLENELDKYTEENESFPDPVLIIGAGLSAADAIIVTRGRNIPVLHVFRNTTTDLKRQLPENMYPEYHKVHQMMKDGGSSYPLYTALPEYSLTDIDESTRVVTLTSKNGKSLKYSVSFAAVLIGSRPNLSFLPRNFNIGLNKNAPVDNKTNTIDINKLKHSVNDVDNLFAIGPLAGDNFVRFIPGGALAVISDLYKRNEY